MPPLLFPLPTTSLLTFSNLLLDPSNSYGGALSQATAARTQLHLALKAVAEKQPGSSALAVVDVRLGERPHVKTRKLICRLYKVICPTCKASQHVLTPICYCIEGILVHIHHCHIKQPY